MLKIKYPIGCLLIASIYLSCDKKESFDIKGETSVTFFTNNESSGNMPQNSINYNVINVPDAAGSGLLNFSSTMPATIQFPVFATRPVSEDVIIAAELDNSLIEQYNAAHNTDYFTFPAGFFYNPTSLSAKILKGETASMDSISLVADLSVLNTLTGSAYIAPIKLTTVSKPQVGKITTSATRVTYIVVNVELRLIRYNATAAQALGSLINPRTSWDVLLTPSPNSMGGNGSIIDGSTSTYSRWGTTTVGQVDVNMQDLKNVTGMRLYTTTSSTLIPTQIEVYLSSDGINYDHIGSPLRANLTYASSYNYILFYKAIPAQYVRLILYYTTSTNTQNRRITELDVYAN